MKKLLLSLIFFAGWILSPFTWWNDAFVNLPLSYLIANLIFYVTRLPLKWLLILSYWLTNFLGLLLMYWSGKSLIFSSKDRRNAILLLIIAMLVYSTIVIYLDRQGKLLPLGKLFQNLLK